MNRFSELLREAMFRNGLSTRDVAADISISASSVNCWLNQGTFPRSESAVHRLSSALRISSEDLISAWVESRRRSKNLESHLSESLFKDVIEKSGGSVIGPYESVQIPVECICPNGHRCFPTPHNVISGQGWCSVCYGHHFVSHDDAVEKAKSVCPSFKPLSEYPGSTSPWMGECLDCGELVTPCLGNLVQGQGCCVKCGRAKFKNTFIDRYSQGFYDAASLAKMIPLTSYVNNRTPVDCRCPAGHVVKVRPSDVLNKGYKWCVPCSYSGRMGIRRKDGKWEAWANYQGAKLYVGKFLAPEEAARARDAKMRQLGAPESRMNFPLS